MKHSAIGKRKITWGQVAIVGNILVMLISNADFVQRSYYLGTIGIYFDLFKYETLFLLILLAFRKKLTDLVYRFYVEISEANPLSVPSMLKIVPCLAAIGLIGFQSWFYIAGKKFRFDRYEYELRNKAILTLEKKGDEKKAMNYLDQGIRLFNSEVCKETKLRFERNKNLAKLKEELIADMPVPAKGSENLVRDICLNVKGPRREYLIGKALASFKRAKFAYLNSLHRIESKDYVGAANWLDTLNSVSPGFYSTNNLLSDVRKAQSKKLRPEQSLPEVDLVLKLGAEKYFELSTHDRFFESAPPVHGYCEG